MQQRQILAEKLVNLPKNQSKINCSSTSYNKNDTTRSSLNNKNFYKKLAVKEKYVETQQSIRAKKNQFTGHKKGDSITKCLRSDDLSTSKSIVTVTKHPGCSTEDMIDCIKSIARKNQISYYSMQKQTILRRVLIL